jgi:hypothetical protein
VCGVKQAQEATRQAVAKRCDACCRRFGKLGSIAPRVLIAVIVCALLGPIDSLVKVTLEKQALETTRQAHTASDVDSTAVGIAGKQRKVALATLTATLSDFFSDWADSLHPTIVATLFRETLRTVACEYIRAFARVSASRKSYRKSRQEGEHVAELIKFDIAQMRTFVAEIDKAFPDVYGTI